MEQVNSKKTLIVSLIAVLVLVGSVVGVAYAMFSFSATGTQTNVIKTGYVTVNYAESKLINLTNALPTADSAVSETTTNTLAFDVTATINGTMTVNYDLAIDSSTIVEGSTLKKDDIKIKLLKSTDGTTYSAVTAVTNVTIASLASRAGTYASSTNASAGTGVTTYALDSGQFTNSGTVKYKLIAWVSSSYALDENVSVTTNTDTTNKTTTQSKGTTSQTFKFGVKVVAGQANYGS